MHKSKIEKQMLNNSTSPAILPMQCYMPCLSHGSLFSGIGGFDLAAHWHGWINVFHCEINPIGRRVLSYYWPNAESLIDIKTTDFKKYASTIDVLSGGFPCQPYSSAGKRKGKEDERHLWPEMLRAVREISPRYVVGENVRGLTNWNGGLVFDEVQADLEAQGYEVLPFLLPACSKDAPHQRDRIWFVAHSKNVLHKGNEREFSEAHGGSEQYNLSTFGKPGQRLFTEGAFADGAKQGLQVGNDTGKVSGTVGTSEGREPSGIFAKGDWSEFPTVSPIHWRDDGVPAGLDGITLSKWREESIKAFGNAIVPQVAYEIFKVIATMSDSRHYL